jgi:tRNA threonylcarbamoyladenosine biosynthesis protein TsaE
VNEYPRLRDGRLLYHIDCYRLEEEAQIVTAGLEDILNNGGAIMVEWPERIDYLLPEDRLWIELRYISDTRRGLRMNAVGDRPAKLLRQFRQSAFGV